MVNNQDLLQQELKEKVKEGVKPSDLKKKTQISISPEEQDNQEIKKLQSAIKLQHEIIVKKQSKLEELERKIKDLEGEKESYFKEIQSLENNEKDLLGKVKEKQEELEKIKEQLNQKKPAETKERATQTETLRNFTIKNYSCGVCQISRQEGLSSQLLRVKGLGGETGKKI